MIDQIIEYNKTFVAQKGYETHPLVPKDVVVRGFIIDSETGALEEIGKQHDIKLRCGNCMF